MQEGLSNGRDLQSQVFTIKESPELQVLSNQVPINEPSDDEDEQLNSRGYMSRKEIDLIARQFKILQKTKKCRLE